MLARAYDIDGDKRPFFALEEGDIISWKQDGSTGFRRGRVTALAEKNFDGSPNKKPIRIAPEDGGRARWIGRAAVMRIFDQHGIRKSPASQENANG